MPDPDGLQQLITRMPGGANYIGTRWRQERVDVKMRLDYDADIDEQDYTFAGALFMAVLAEYGPPMSDEDNDDPTITVPRLVADLLQFWSDRDLYGFWAEEVSA